MSSLAALRAAIGRNDAMLMDESAVVLSDGRRLDRKEATNFYAKRGTGDPYTLDSVFFQFQHQETRYQPYLEACAEAGVEHVNLIDKKDLLAYLRGDISECAGLIATKKSAVDAGPHSAPDAGDDRCATLSASAKKRQRSDQGRDALDASELAKSSRDQRCLDAVLCVANWDFTVLREKLSKEIENMRTSANGNVRARPVASSNGSSNGKAGSSSAAKAYDPRGDRYSAPEDRFWRENMGSDFYQLGIDPTKSFKLNSAKPSALSAASSGAASVPGTSATDSAIKRSQPHGASQTGVREEVKRPLPVTRAAGIDRPPKRSRFSAKDQMPIIIVPGSTSATSMLTLHNIAEFLQDGQFSTVKETRARGDGVSMMTSRITIRRKPAGSIRDGAADYEILSNPKRLTNSEWDRVVACVCTGQEWQFKDWEGWNEKAKDKGIPAILQSMCGFVFHYEDDARPKAAEDWAVTFLPLARYRRHNDIKVQMRFWESIDAHCRLRNKNLRF
jgi:RNA pol II accessory factor, Cdc73 family, C-terminal/Paf1 complex subunit CDC73 N-terminal